MERRRSVPVLISFKKLQLSGRVTSSQQPDDDVTEGNTFAPVNHLGQRRNCLLRSFSLHSVLPKTNMKSKVGNERKLKNLSDANLGIERFERDFVWQLLKNGEPDESCSTKLSGEDNSDGILNDKAKTFHSSSDSIPTDTDSGIFSRLSPADLDSDDSMEITNELHEYSDDDIDVGLKSATNPSLSNCTRSKISAKRKSQNQALSKKPFTTISIPKTEDCVGTVTVNGLCYHCS